MVEIGGWQANGRQRLHRTLHAIARGQVGIGERQDDVAQHGGTRQEVEALEDEAQARGAQLRQLVVGELRDVEAFQ